LKDQKRPFDTFISHAHIDKKSIVDRLDFWLNNVCKIKAWYDDRDLPPGAQIATELSSAVIKCRSMIIILSKNSVESGWVKEEFAAAANQRAATRGAFRIIGVRIEEDCQVPVWLETTKFVDIPGGNISQVS
jgi:hypothetical protein